MGILLIIANNSRCSLTVNSSNRISCWGQTPKAFRISDIFSAIEFPLTNASPEVGEISPVKMLRNVVLPIVNQNNNRVT